jgi:hypothetical protein
MIQYLLKNLLFWTVGASLLFTSSRRVPGPEMKLQALAPDPAVQALVDQVTTTDVYAMVGNLSGENPVTIDGVPATIATRVTPAYQASQYVYEQLSALGLGVEYFYYFSSDREVIAEQPGTDGTQCIYLIGAHLDSTSENAKVSAPGADDNASGATGVLIAAKILSDTTFRCTIRYALFTGEEQGLYGSAEYAQHLADSGENLNGVLNLDMIAYDSNSNGDLDLVVRPRNNADLPIAQTMMDVITAYELPLTPTLVRSSAADSDHYSFWYPYGKEGPSFPAILAIESEVDFNEAYHSTEDQRELLNIPYFTNFVKAAVATLAHLAEPAPDDPQDLPFKTHLPLLRNSLPLLER